MSADIMVGALEAGDLERLEGLLDGLLARTDALAALLLDRSGQMLTAAGGVDGFDVTTFASLAAADFAASDRLADLLGEGEFASLYHHGDNGSMYLVDVDGTAILATLFDDRTTLGLLRLEMKTTVPELASVFTELSERGAGAAPAELQSGWLEEAEDEIDRLFAE